MAAFVAGIYGVYISSPVQQALPTDAWCNHNVRRYTTHISLTSFSQLPAHIATDCSQRPILSTSFRETERAFPVVVPKA